MQQRSHHRAREFEVNGHLCSDKDPQVPSCTTETSKEICFSCLCQQHGPFLSELLSTLAHLPSLDPHPPHFYHEVVLTVKKAREMCAVTFTRVPFSSRHALGIGMDVQVTWTQTKNRRVNCNTAFRIKLTGCFSLR